MEELKEVEARILARVLEAIPPALASGKVALDTNLRRELGLDSLGLASFLFGCGEALGVDQDELIEVLSTTSIHTVGDAVSAFSRLLCAAEGGARA